MTKTAPSGDLGNLQYTSFPTGIEEFHRLPTLLTGRHHAILIDGPFRLSTGEQIAAAIRASGKRLTTIFVTCHDPDFYFGLAPVVAAFPGVAVLAPPAIAAQIAATAAHKLDVWRPQYGADIPPSLDAVVFPCPFDGDTLILEDEAINIVATRQDGHFHLWLPRQRAILGGVQISSDNHVWMADMPCTTPALRSVQDAALIPPLFRRQALRYCAPSRQSRTLSGWYRAAQLRPP